MDSIFKKPTQLDHTISNSSGKLKRLASEFYYDQIMLREYAIRDSGERLQIYVPFDSDWKNDIKPILCKTPNLLCAMLSLKERMSVELFDPSIRVRDSNVKKADLDLIIKWCIKNGFPFKPNFEYKPLGKPLFELQPVIFFMVWDFIERLNQIHNAYWLYQIISGQKEDEIDPKNKYHDMSAEKCKILFEEIYQEIQFVNRISFKPDVHWEVKTENLFDAAFYQLALLLNEPKKSVRVCPLCKIYFERTHANRKYCTDPMCYPEKAYKRRRSAK